MARQLWNLTGRELSRVQDHILLLIKSAHERVATFLLEMANRLSGGNAVDLPMSRQDIADYLGLTIETVCRALTELKKLDVIAAAERHHVIIRNHSALRSIATGGE